MASDYEIPKKIGRYLKRLEKEYESGPNSHLSPVLANSKCKVNIETAYDNWDGGMNGHDIILFVPDDLMGNIPLDDQQDIQRQLAQDLNKAASGAQNEYINDVHFEYLEDEDAIEPESVGVIASDRIWQPNSLKLFISHRDTHKVAAHKLADALIEYDISSFVAHDSIEPDEDWQNEIEKALQSMDVMLAFITDDFFDSAWTNQEIGFALAKTIPVISLKLEKADPIGFIKNRQAIKGSLNSVESSSSEIYATIKKRIGSSTVFRGITISKFARSGTYDAANTAFLQLKELTNLSEEEVECIVSAYNSNDQLYECWNLSRDNKICNFLSENSNSNWVLSNRKLRSAPPKPAENLPF